MGFFKNNQVLIVMNPFIIGTHYGWSLLQNDKRYVPEGKNEGQPIFIIAKKTWNYLTKKNDSSD